MCIVPAMIGKAIGGRTGAIIGGGLGGGIPGALVTNTLLGKKKSPAPATSYGG